MSPVVIEVVPPEAPPDLVKEMLDGCSASLGSGACRLVTADTGARPVERAIVRWKDPDELHVAVEVGVGELAARHWTERALVFKEADTSAARFRAIGLTVAALVAEQTSAASGSASPEESKPVGTGAEPALPPPRHEDAVTPTSSVWIGIAGTVGNGLDRGAARVGGRLDAGFRPSDWPLFFRLQAGYAVRPADARGLEVDFKTATLTAGTILGAGFVSIEPRIGGGVDVARASASLGSRSESKGRLATGLYVGADLVLRLGRFGIVGGLDAWHLDSRTTVLVAGQDAGIAVQNAWALSLGARVFFPPGPSP